MSLLPEQWQIFHQYQYSDLETLSNWAVDSRYPNSLGKASVGEALEALDQAEEILRLVQKRLETKGLEILGSNLTIKSHNQGQASEEE